MNGVLGMADLLLDAEIPLEQRKLVEVIHGSGRELLSLLDDLLDMSKIEAGRLALEDIAFDPAGIAVQALRLFAVRAQAKGLDLALCIDRTMPHKVSGDPHRLGQVLKNLVGNAIKFTEEGGVIIELRALEHPQEGRCVLEIDVVDTGIGIPDDVKDSLFQPFTQVDSSFARRYGGSGMGLAISRQLIHLMEGTIELESSQGEGSRFRIKVPFTVEETALTGEARLAGSRVVVVHGDARFAGVIVRQLEELGAQARHESLTWTPLGDSHAPDAVIVDAGASALETRVVARRLSRELAPEVAKVALVPLGEESGEGNEGILDLARPAAPQDLVRALELHETTRPVTLPDENASATEFALRVLVVDDNPVNLKVALRMLERLGCEGIGVEEGGRALELAQRERFDLVLMDCQMPGMDGFECTRRLQELPAFGDTPVIALTANAMEGDRQRCLDAGMVDHVAKPISKARLATVLERWSSPELVDA
jgi:CheY-like chemotaxis protein